MGPQRIIGVYKLGQVCRFEQARKGAVYVPIHTAGQVRLGEVAAFGVIAPTVGFDASQIMEHDTLAFSWNAMSVFEGGGDGCGSR